jgi:hypothetical protein
MHTSLEWGGSPSGVEHADVSAAESICRVELNMMAWYKDVRSLFFTRAMHIVLQETKHAHNQTRETK